VGHRGEPVEVFARRRLGAAAARWAALNQALLAHDDVVAVHAWRVEVRDVRSLLWALEPAILGARRLRRRLGRLRRSTGRVRDLDVVVAWVIAHQERGRPGAGRLRRWLRARRRSARSRARRGWRSARLRRAVRRLRRMGRRPSLGAVGAWPAALVLRARIWRAWGAVAEEWPRRPTLGRLHQARKDVKRLRYLIELVRAGRRRDGVPWIARRLSITQDQLGALQDAVIVRAWLARAAAVVGRSPAWSALRQQNRREIAALRAASARAIHRLIRRGRRPILAFIDL
jgi:CHAD domain-containing protein